MIPGHAKLTLSFVLLLVCGSSLSQQPRSLLNEGVADGIAQEEQCPKDRGKDGQDEDRSTSRLSPGSEGLICIYRAGRNSASVLSHLKTHP